MLVDVIKTNNIHDEYELFEKIGSGTYGNVYLAKYKKEKGAVKCALKIVKRTHDCLREIDHLVYLQKMKIPWILPIRRIIFYTNEKKMGMEFPLGQSPRKYFNDMLRKLTLQEYLEKTQKLFIEMLQCVKWFHCAGIVHRDIKPENMIIWKDHVYMIDFGFSIRLFLPKLIDLWNRENEKARIEADSHEKNMILVFSTNSINQSNESPLPGSSHEKKNFNQSTDSERNFSTTNESIINLSSSKEKSSSENQEKNSSFSSDNQEKNSSSSGNEEKNSLSSHQSLNDLESLSKSVQDLDFDYLRKSLLTSSLNQDSSYRTSLTKQSSPSSKNQLSIARESLQNQEESFELELNCKEKTENQNNRQISLSSPSYEYECYMFADSFSSKEKEIKNIYQQEFNTSSGFLGSTTTIENEKKYNNYENKKQEENNTSDDMFVRLTDVEEEDKLKDFCQKECSYLIVSLNYRSPELMKFSFPKKQKIGARTVTVLKSVMYDHLIDEWALGCTFYELLTGDIAFEGTKEEDVHSEHRVYRNFMRKEESKWWKDRKQNSDDYEYPCWVTAYTEWFKDECKERRISFQKNPTIQEYFQSFLKLIQALLIIDPEKRNSCDQILQTIAKENPQLLSGTDQDIPQKKSEKSKKSPILTRNQAKKQNADRTFHSYGVYSAEKDHRRESLIYKVQLSFTEWWKTLYRYIRMQNWKGNENLRIQAVLRLLIRVWEENQLDIEVFYISIANWLFWITSSTRVSPDSMRGYLDSFLVSFRLASQYCSSEKEDIFDIVCLILKKIGLAPPKSIKDFFDKTEDLFIELLIRAKAQCWFPNPLMHRKERSWCGNRDNIYLYYLLCALNKSQSVFHPKKIPVHKKQHLSSSTSFVRNKTF